MNVTLIRVLLAVAALLLLVAVTPRQLLAHLGALEQLQQHRPQLATAGVALALALGVSYLL